MTRRAGAIEYRRLRAPREDGGRLLQPTAEQLLADSSVASRSLEFAGHDLGGVPLGDVARRARTDLVDAAKRYIAEDAHCALDAIDANRPLILTGHQPGLFHPGVWFKNFVTAHFAEQLGGHAVNLLIDNDLARDVTVRVPIGTVADPQLNGIPFDQAVDVLPLEERRIVDGDTFKSFPERVVAAMAPWGWDPVVESIWPSAIAASQSRETLGECLAAARRQLERTWGIHNLEVPLSTVCEQPPFCRFLVHLLTRLPEFHQIYNDSLTLYRRVNRVRSKTHPVPALQSANDWCEAPFWIWTATSRQRRPLYVRSSGDQLELSDRDRFQTTLTVPSSNELDTAIGQILGATGTYKLRPRALTTTMFARLFLGDLFVHGLGGAKYDQLTDSIIERFFGFPAPPFAVATASLLLPVTRGPSSCEELPKLRQQLRALHFQPERFVIRTAGTDRWLDEKANWIRREAKSKDALQRHQGIERANEALRQFVRDRRTELLAEQHRLTISCRNERIWNSREFSFCLFPEQTLRRRLLDF